MDQETTFFYQYSAKGNAEIEEIRKKYLPEPESKLEELKRLDGIVRSSGIVEALCAGIGGAVIFGFGMCLTLEVIGTSIFATVIGILLGLAGLAGMLTAFPVYRKVMQAKKAELTPRILELAAELSAH